MCLLAGIHNSHSSHFLWHEGPYFWFCWSSCLGGCCPPPLPPRAKSSSAPTLCTFLKFSPRKFVWGHFCGLGLLSPSSVLHYLLWNPLSTHCSQILSCVSFNFWEIFSQLFNISLGMCSDTSSRLLPLWNHGPFMLCPYIWALNSDWWELHKWCATGTCRKDNSGVVYWALIIHLAPGHGFDIYYEGALTGLIYRWTVNQKRAQGCAFSDSETCPRLCC